MIDPAKVRVESSSLCQLNCPLCPRINGQATNVIEKGRLSLDDFKHLIDQNPGIRMVELSNFGEAFLNRDLPKILAYADAMNVRIRFNGGVNLNYASDAALEAVVKYRTTAIRCSIDGITQEVYEHYRKGGDLRRVLNNIKKINAFKKQYNTQDPCLIFQFIVFGHNENQIREAALLARMLNMVFAPKLNLCPDLMQVRNKDEVRSLVGYADRREYLEKTGQEYLQHQCCQLWNSPQINWDGKLLGCSRNIWEVYEENVFQHGLRQGLNNEKMNYARQMLMGKVPIRQDMPCRHCDIYHSRAARNAWVSREELEADRQGCCGSVKEGSTQFFTRSLTVKNPKTIVPGWQYTSIFNGIHYGGFANLSVHLSTLEPETLQHPPQGHDDEEIVIPLSGKVRTLLDSLVSRQDTGAHCILENGFIYHSSHHAHTKTAAENSQVHYAVIRWQRVVSKNSDETPFCIIIQPAETYSKVNQGWEISQVEALETRTGGRLKAHYSRMMPGQGYDLHQDPFDIILVLLKGSIETNRERIEAPAVVFYSAGLSHSLKNGGEVPAEYLVFEFMD